MPTLAAASEFVEYRPDSSACWPVVLSAPHGGALEPESIPDRTTGCFEPDWQSWQLAEAVRSAFAAEAPAGGPAFVGLRLVRGKSDGNRPRCPSCEPVSASPAQAAAAGTGPLLVKGKGKSAASHLPPVHGSASIQITKISGHSSPSGPPRRIIPSFRLLRV